MTAPVTAEKPPLYLVEVETTYAKGTGPHDCLFSSKTEVFGFRALERAQECKEFELKLAQSTKENDTDVVEVVVSLKTETIL